MKQRQKGQIKKVIDATTVKVEVQKIKTHPKYHKQFNLVKNFLAVSTKEHKTGDLVEIEAIAPKSKRKTWKVL